MHLNRSTHEIQIVGQIILTYSQDHFVSLLKSLLLYLGPPFGGANWAQAFSTQTVIAGLSHLMSFESIHNHVM